ncbi:MAG TPA: CocE/NonD family hydrolase [Syntrophobacter fumaroxidans]|mgnify:CR=1 FL=1|nr:CocE/NonD family hydrolase [Syntrophobacter fumaroxidans]
MFKLIDMLSQKSGDVPAPADDTDNGMSADRRSFLFAAAWLIGAGIAPGFLLRAPGYAGEGGRPVAAGPPEGLRSLPAPFPARDKVPDPERITFTVRYPGKDSIKLEGHFWYNKDARAAGRKCPAIVELNPYRRRDGMMSSDSGYYPWFAYHEYLCFRVDLQGAGDSQGILTDEYTDEELVYCTQVIEQIAAHPSCDGNVGMTGTSWSAINSLMVAARADCPPALKAVLVICGTDDRYNDDVHYMNGAMMQDNIGWASSMFGWLAQPPDPLVVGDRWKSMWRARIRAADFWFKHWGKHQARDLYWSASSVRDRYGRVKVPVYIVSGYQDGYKNPVPRVVGGLRAAGMPVQGLIGPWGHASPNSGYPGPRIDWLPYVLTHWWDRWLKGKTPDPDTELPELTVWLGESKEPKSSSCGREKGRWAAEDGEWTTRVRERIFYLWPDRRLRSALPDSRASVVGTGDLVVAARMLETSSWGHCGNNDLPGDQSQADAASLHFDSAPLPKDLDCFGYPTARLKLSCNKSIASIAVRLCEVSPDTEASHLVSYRFFNLCCRDGDMAKPRPVEPGVVFDVTVPLNVIGHTFKQGWRIRLSVSPSFFPTMCPSPELATITLYAGRAGTGSRMSALSLPERKPRSEDARLESLLPPDPRILWVDSGTYVPTATARNGEDTRLVRQFTVLGKKGTVVRKTTDYGRYRYDGPLEGLWVDEVDRENFMVVHDEPLTFCGYTSSRVILDRNTGGSHWKVMARRTTRVWSEWDSGGRLAFRYKATIRTFVGTPGGGWEPFENKTVEGTIPRLWV